LFVSHRKASYAFDLITFPETSPGADESSLALPTAGQTQGTMVSVRGAEKVSNKKNDLKRERYQGR